MKIKKITNAICISIDAHMRFSVSDFGESLNLEAENFQETFIYKHFL